MTDMKKRCISLLLAALLILGAAAEAFAADDPAETAPPIEPEVPVDTETPAETEAPVGTETPAATDAPAQTEAPETEPPAETEIPVETETPAPVDAPAPADETGVPIVYDDPDGLIFNKEQYPYVPRTTENRAFSLYLKKTAALRVTGGVAECLGASDASYPDSAVYKITPDPAAKELTVKAVADGAITLLVENDAGAAVIRTGWDKLGTDDGTALADGMTFVAALAVHIVLEEGYMPVETTDCQWYGSGSDSQTVLMLLRDVDGDGQVKLTIAPAVTIKADTPPTYDWETEPDENAPIVKYSTDEGKTFFSLTPLGVPGGSLLRLRLPEKLAISTDVPSILKSWYEDAYHFYLLQAPASGILSITEIILPDNPFKDVDSSKWYHDSILLAYASGVVKGDTPDTFLPNASASRGQAVTMLYRLSGSPEVTEPAPFTDLTADYYKDAVAWAAEKKVVLGAAGTTFEPDRNVTREQLAAMLWRKEGQPAADISRLKEFSDGDMVNTYAQEAMSWAIGAGVINGNSDGTLKPRSSATRAEVCAMLMRYAG